MIRAVYAGLLLGFGVASFVLSRSDHERFILPMLVFAVAGVVAVRR